MGGLLEGSPCLVSSWRTCRGAAVAAGGPQQHLVLLSSGQSGPDAVLHFRELDPTGAVVSQVSHHSLEGIE